MTNISDESWEKGSYMNPAPPVIMIVPTSGNGSNLVVPLSIGASFQMLALSRGIGAGFCTPLGLDPASTINVVQVKEGKVEPTPAFSVRHTACDSVAGDTN